MSEVDRIREELASYGERAQKSGLAYATGGNISARVGDVIYIKPSGFAFDELKPDMYIGIDIASGKVVDGDLKPSCETPMHLACYRVREDVKAVLHTHPVYTMAVISSGNERPAMFPEFVDDLGSVGYADYALRSTDDLANIVREIIKSNNVCMMRNHGLLCVAATIRHAFNRSILVENAAKIYVIAKLVGTPQALTEEQIRDVESLKAVDHRRTMAKEL